MINSLKVYFIKSLDDSYLKRSLKSFHNTVPSSSDFEIIIVEEKNQREETLNYILSINERTDLKINFLTVKRLIFLYLVFISLSIITVYILDKFKRFSRFSYFYTYG